MRPQRGLNHLVGGKLVERFLERARQRAHTLLADHRVVEVVQVLFDGLRQLELALDAIHTSRQHGRKGQVRVAARVRTA